MSRSDEVARLARRDVGQVRHAVEVHEDHATAPLHEPPRRHRRVDAAGEQRRHRAARAHRQPARARPAVAVDEGLARQHLDVDVQLGMLEARRASGAARARGRRARDSSPASESGKVLNARRAVMRNDAKRRPSVTRSTARLSASMSGAVRSARAKLATPKTRPMRSATASASTPAVEAQHDAARQLLHARGTEVAEGAREVLLQPAEEDRPVAALEADLVVVDDDHRRARRRFERHRRLGRARMLGPAPVDGLRHLDLGRLARHRLAHARVRGLLLFGIPRLV